MKYRTSKRIGTNKKIYVRISLDDDCGNGHQDFSITGDVYNSLTSTADCYFETGGCIHKEIKKHFPEFKIFIGLHLASYKGVPMYAVENGYYHLKNGFNNTKPDNELFPTEFSNYYRIPQAYFGTLNESENQTDFAIKLMEFKIPELWKKQAGEAIEMLEGLTGKTFMNTSKKETFTAPSTKEIKQFKEKVRTGYYTDEAREERARKKALAEKEKNIKEINEECEKSVKKAERKRDIKLHLLEVGGYKALDNSIYYNHSDEINFNWRGYGDKLTEKEINYIKDNFKLDVKFSNKKGE